jgi:hypothetical protein
MAKKAAARGKPPADAVSLVRELRRRGFLLQDLLGVMLGHRPMCHSGAAPDGPGTQELFNAFLKTAGLRAIKRGTLLTIGRDKAALEEFEALSKKKAASRDTDHPAALARRMGELLGYPACCAEAFADTESHAHSRTAAPAVSFPKIALARSGPGPFHFSMNFLYNFHSRSSGPKGELGLLLKAGYDSMDRHLLPWIPCGFECEPSLRYGAKLYGVLRDCEPFFAEETKRRLATAIVALDDWSFVPLLGSRREADGWRYDAVLPVATLAPASTVSLLAAGNRLRRGGGGYEVLRDAAPLGFLAAPHAVYDFAEAP